MASKEEKLFGKRLLLKSTKRNFKREQRQLLRTQKSREKRLSAEFLNKKYIPKDLGECFIELDKLLKDSDKATIRSSPETPRKMIPYHMGLGMWIRNNWKLWAGSRLKKYFIDKEIFHPDNMSSIILELYYGWLKGDKEGWKKWEKNPKT